MDDRTWRLAIGTLAAAVGAVMLDAALPEFQIDSGFWMVLAGAFAFLGGRSVFRSRNGNGNGE